MLLGDFKVSAHVINAHQAHNMLWSRSSFYELVCLNQRIICASTKRKVLTVARPGDQVAAKVPAENLLQLGLLQLLSPRLTKATV
jgi:hypothetical protein